MRRVVLPRGLTPRQRELLVDFQHEEDKKAKETRAQGTGR
jgi:hypothetical protein